MAQRKQIDWEAVEREYRAGVRTLRDIADEHGCSHVAIKRRADKEEWPRDLGAKIQAQVEEKVTKAEVTKFRNEGDLVTEREVVATNAQMLADKILGQREDVQRARSIVQKLFAELDAQVDHAPELDELGELMRDPEATFDRLNDTYRKVTSLAGRVKIVKDLADALRVLIELERKVLRIRDDAPGPEEIAKSAAQGAAMGAAEAYALMIGK